MRIDFTRRFLFCALALAGRPAAHAEVSAYQQFDASPGNAVFQAHCAACHVHEGSGAPAKFMLNSLSSRSIYAVLTQGVMKGQAAVLTDTERRQVAEYLAHKSLQEHRGNPPALCATQAGWFDERKAASIIGWGIDAENTRQIALEQAAMPVAAVKNLELAWAFAYPDVDWAVAQPLVVGGGLFVGSADGTVYALDARSGCVHWTFKASAEVPGGIVFYPAIAHAATDSDGRPTLFFGDRLAHVYAVDANTGELLWKVKVDAHPGAEAVGTPALLNDRLYVPVISLEEEMVSADYVCCTFRGSIVALERSSGKQLWKRYTIESPPRERTKAANGKRQLGPSGAGIWSTPTLDRRRGLIFFATGNGYSEPGDGNSDALFAIDLATGKVRWRTQTFRRDNWNYWDFKCRQDGRAAPDAHCVNLSHPGPDVDFSASVVLVHGPGERDILVAGRKDGLIFGVSPDTGKILWSERRMPDTDARHGEFFFGMMAAGGRVYIPSISSRMPSPSTPVSTATDGVYALDAFTGNLLWQSPAVADCGRATACLGSASAPIGTSEVLFSGSGDGYVRAYAADTGKVLWRTDTAREFTTLNGEVAKGGAVSRNGIMVADGMLYVNSGYGPLPGNVLLAFTVDKGQGTGARHE